MNVYIKNSPLLLKASFNQVADVNEAVILLFL